MTRQLTIAALCVSVTLSLSLVTPRAARGQASTPQPQTQAALDARVRAFLDSHKNSWHDLNVPAADGQTLHDLIVKHRFTQALEIGTSTGHSGIWIAWALSKTGGKLTTIEIDPDRHAQALENFKAAGLDGYIDARLGDAHELTRTLPGPFDFVFSDADKGWYPNYLTAVWPKLRAGGCFTAHNVTMRTGGIQDFLDALKRLPDGTTTIDRGSSEGISITCKTAP
jgi:predicted O-methyltransferase YrrM